MSRKYPHHARVRVSALIIFFYGKLRAYVNYPALECLLSNCTQFLTLLWRDRVLVYTSVCVYAPVCVCASICACVSACTCVFVYICLDINEQVDRLPHSSHKYAEITRVKNQHLRAPRLGVIVGQLFSLFNYY